MTGLESPPTTGALGGILLYPKKERATFHIPQPIEREAIEVSRVLIVENQRLLGAGLQALLTENSDLDIIGVSPSNQIELVRKIRQLQPDVVFLSEGSRLTNAVDLLALLEDYPRLRVVVISANDHLVRIYDQQQVLIKPANQLLNIIRDS